MSQALRKLTPAINKSNCTVIFINQIREKVGIMFGCLHANTLVNFTDGRAIPIKKVVEEQIHGKVWSYNEETKEFEEKEIIDWHDNGEVTCNEDYIHIETISFDKQSKFEFMVTPDHKIMTKDGWKEAKNIILGEQILSNIDEHCVEVSLIRNATDEEMQFKGKYDISVEDNHNYVVGGVTNGILVHNSPETTTGGRALKFYSSVRIEVRKIEAIKQGGEVIGNRTKAKVVKNKVAPPLKEAQFDIMFGQGIDKYGEIVDMASERDIIQKTGAWYAYNGNKIGQGRENAKTFLKENPEMTDEIYAKLFPAKEESETTSE